MSNMKFQLSSSIYTFVQFKALTLLVFFSILMPTFSIWRWYSPNFVNASLAAALSLTPIVHNVSPSSVQKFTKIISYSTLEMTTIVHQWFSIGERVVDCLPLMTYCLKLSLEARSFKFKKKTLNNLRFNELQLNFGNSIFFCKA